MGAVIVVLIVGRVYTGRLDRERIRKQVEGHGGKILNISWNPFAWGFPATRSARFYDVNYRTHRGQIVSATCTTNLSTGVCWLGAAPPGLAEVGERTGAAASNASADDIARTATDPAEAILCLQCGARMPARSTHCLKCGWSYQG